MSKESKEFRKLAADHLRQSRKKPKGPVKEREKALGVGYKLLAEREEWLAGEKLRSKKREPRLKK